ncbi:MAG: DHH family phosphoesterase [Candidatus Omnitrophota bacterium]
MSSPINKVVEEIEKGRIFLITSHINLEGDALGSELSLAYLLKMLGKNSFVYNASALPNNYKFLPLLYFLDKPRYKIDDFDTAIVVDCSDFVRIGKIKNLITSKKRIINVDHHPDNNYFGTANLVDPTASATGEIVFRLFKRIGVPLNRDVALCIYTAIVSDTGGFRNENTTARTHRIVSQLLNYDLKPSLVFENIYEMYSPARMRLLGLSLENLNIDRKRGIAWMSVSQRLLKNSGASLDDVDGFVEIMRSIKGIKLAILFQEIEKNQIKVGFRSREGVDAGNLARIFGGGGHFAASGCILKGNLEEIEKKVLNEIRGKIK